jgi:hypothetical protein
LIRSKNDRASLFLVRSYHGLRGAEPKNKIANYIKANDKDAILPRRDRKERHQPVRREPNCTFHPN